MNAHELARKLLEGPDLPVVIPSADFYDLEEVAAVGVMEGAPWWEEIVVHREPAVRLS